jgi:L-fucose isomerase-like protein
MSDSSRSHPLKLGLVFLGRKRPGFDPEWGAAMADRVRAAVRKTPFGIFEPPDKVVDDPSLCAALAVCAHAGVDAIVTLQTTMADARLTQTFTQLWPHPILLWATPEKPEGDMISSCSLVGAHCWASILRQMNHPFEVVYGDPGDESTLTQLSEAVRLAYAARRLRSARIGIIGGQAPGYFAMAADPLAVKQALGAQVQLFSLAEFADVVNGLGDDAVAADVAQVKALGLPHKDTADDVLPMASRLYLAMKHYLGESCGLENDDCDALAVRDWPEMPNLFGQWPYVGLARLADEGRPVACEGDADGALTLFAGGCLGLGPGYLSDWLEHDGETITLWHGGMLPFSLSPEPGQPGSPQLALHFNNRKPAVVESTLTPGMPITICRLWRLDGRYRLTACDAETLPPRRHLMGSNGLARLSGRDPRDWFETLCHEGMPHHVAVFRGYHTGLFRRLARMTALNWIA